jgi:hypothetical protein
LRPMRPSRPIRRWRRRSPRGSRPPSRTPRKRSPSPRSLGRCHPAERHRVHGRGHRAGVAVGLGCPLPLRSVPGRNRPRAPVGDQPVFRRTECCESRRSKEIPSIGASTACVGHEAEGSIAVRCERPSQRFAAAASRSHGSMRAGIRYFVPVCGTGEPLSLRANPGGSGPVPGGDGGPLIAARRCLIPPARGLGGPIKNGRRAEPEARLRQTLYQSNRQPP